MTRRTALLACLSTVGAVVEPNPELVTQRGLGLAQTPGQPNLLIVSLGNSPYEVGGLELHFKGAIKTFTAAEAWAAIVGAP